MKLVDFGQTPSSRAGTVEHPTLAAPVPAEIVTVPRLTFVNQETDDANNPVFRLISTGPGGWNRWRTSSTSPRPNTWPRPRAPSSATGFKRHRRSASSARNSAAYIEFQGSIEIAVVPDATGFLQSARAEDRTGGARHRRAFSALDTLNGWNLEIDYQGMRRGRLLVRQRRRFLGVSVGEPLPAPGQPWPGPHLFWPSRYRSAREMATI